MFTRFSELTLACFLAAAFMYAGPAAAFSESENAAFLESSFLAVLQSEYGISGSTLLSQETLSAIGSLPAYLTWRSNLLADLDAASAMAQTTMGPVQYRQEGQGPRMLVFHGGMTGFDNNFLLSGLVEQGFQLIGFSRPGYLSTPLGQYSNLAQAADLGASLLDSLEIAEPVMVYGTSLGGPAALYFALHYPQRTQALVMQSAVSQAYFPNEKTSDSFLGGFLSGETALDERSWIMLEMARRWPERFFFEYLFITNHYDQDSNWAMAQTCMADAAQRELFTKFLTVSALLSLRMPASNLETQWAMELPALPLQTIEAPALITQDLMDADVDFNHAQNMVNLLPQAELYATRGAGHLYMFGDTWPGTFQRMVDFMKAASQP